MVVLARLRALPLQLVLLATLQTCQAALTAWRTDIGSQVMLQNSSTGDIMYSDCNSYDSPIYAYDPTKTFKLAYVPRNGTALAGVGWFNDKITIASIWYQDNQGRIANAFLDCDMSSGKFTTKANVIVSDDAPSVNSETGLAAVLLSSTAGYRVYFHDKNMNINQITYSNDNGWAYDKIISQASPSSPAIHAYFHDSVNFNISVVTPFDDQNLEVTRWTEARKWQITTAPTPLKGELTTETTNQTDISLNSTTKASFSLPAWAAKPQALGISADSAKTRSVWYIGTDSKLHQVVNINSAWQLYPDQTSAFWPQADGPNVDLAVTSSVNSSSAWLYYFSNNSITEVKNIEGVWQDAVALATFNASAPGANPNGVNSSNGSSDSGAGLSSGAKAGIGVGVSLGVLAIGGAAFALWFFQRRSARKGQDENKAAEMEAQNSHAANADFGAPPSSSTWGSEHKDYYVRELDTTPTAAEMDTGPQPVYELPDQLYSHELPEQLYSHELVGSAPPSPEPLPGQYQNESQLLPEQKLLQNPPQQKYQQ